MSGVAYRQLELRWVELDSTRGTETNKKPPCVILQGDVVNQGSPSLLLFFPVIKIGRLPLISNPQRRMG